MFQWLSDIITALLEFVPRRVIIRNTHAGVKWRVRGGPVEMKPGWRVWWPLLSDIEVIPTARQTLNTSVQALMTKDEKQIVVGAVIVYSIRDVVLAIGSNNYDVDETAHDIVQAAVVEIITSRTLLDILPEINGNVEKDLTAKCRKNLRCYGIYVSRAALTDFSVCRSLNLLGVNLNVEQ